MELKRRTLKESISFYLQEFDKGKIDYECLIELIWLRMAEEKKDAMSIATEEIQCQKKLMSNDIENSQRLSITN